jgi:transposase-like protein
MVFSYWELIVKMPNKADKFDLRLRLVRYALDHGVKPAARAFSSTPKTVRKWLRRYRQERLAGLEELPRIPLSCPHKTPPQVERRVVQLRRQFPFMGAKRLKFMHALPCCHEAIRRILREHGLVAKRRKKHQRKKDLREVKKLWKLFRHFTVDTKQLKDIPHYWPQMQAMMLPRYQFTAREVRSGLMFLGYANQDTAANACLFATALCQHLTACGVDPQGVRFQTDNGHEFIGCTRQDGSRDGFEKTVQGFRAVHKRIPIKAWSYNSDVETVHATIESEFFDLENFTGIRDFHRRIASYLAWYNLLRPNMNKDNQSPCQIIQGLRPQTSPALARLPPLMLDWLGPDYTTRQELSLRGYHVPWYPLFWEPCRPQMRDRTQLLREGRLTTRARKQESSAQSRNQQAPGSASGRRGAGARHRRLILPNDLGSAPMTPHARPASPAGANALTGGPAPVPVPPEG